MYNLNIYTLFFFLTNKIITSQLYHLKYDKNKYIDKSYTIKNTCINSCQDDKV